MNKVILLGNLTEAPQKFSLSEDRIGYSFTLATNETYIDKKGDKQKISQFHKCINYNPKNLKYIEAVAKKGTLTTIEGALSYTTSEKDGIKYHNTHIIVDTIAMYNLDKN